MLSSVFVSGQIGDFDVLRKDIRYVNVSRVVPSSNGGSYKIDKFPVLINYSGSLLNTGKTGQMIVFKGRLENLDDFGLVLVEELCEVYTATKK